MKLYKYLSPDRVDVLTSLHVRFTQPADFNDPFELAPHVVTLFSSKEEEEFLAESRAEATGLSERILKNSLSASGLTVEELDRELVSRGAGVKARELITDADLAEMMSDVMTGILDHLIEEVGPEFGRAVQSDFNARFGILSLSKISTSLLMWAHYAASHRGFVIELDSKHTFFHDSRSMGAVGRLMPVRYSLERPQVSVSELPYMQPILYSNMVRDVLLTKSLQWEYEGEYRMVFPLDDPDYYPHRLIKGWYHVFPVPPEAITGVIFGARVASSTKKAVIKAITSNPSLKHVQLSQVSISETRFEVNIEPLEIA